MTTQPNGTIPFDRILNFRDVALHTNHFSGRQHLTPGLLHRSARPDAATPADRHTLTATLGIKTIIDLRTPTEHIDALKKHNASPNPIPSAPALAPGDPKRPFRISGIRYEVVNLNGDAYTNALLKQLNWTQTAQLYAYYALGYRKDAIAILASNVMSPRGLSGLAIDTLTYSAPIIASLFNDVLSKRESYPLLVHCTQGKDRTGLVVLLVLLVCGVEVEVIERDYLASGEGLAPEREEKVKEVLSVGFPAGFADCEVGWVVKVVAWLEEEGGVDGYLAQAGVARDVLEGVRAILVS